MEDVPARKPDAAGSGARQLRMSGLKARHVARWITCPGLSADVLIEPAVTVGHNVEACDFLIPQIDAKRIRVLLAEFVVGHGVDKRPRAQIFCVPAWPRQRADDCGR